MNMACYGVLEDRVLLMVEGFGAAAFLNRQLTNLITHEHPCYTALLSPQGRVRFDFFVVPVEGVHGHEKIVIDVDYRMLDALVQEFEKKRLRDSLAFVPMNEWRVVAGWGEIPPEKTIKTYSDPRYADFGWRAIVALVSHENKASLTGGAFSDYTCPYYEKMYEYGVPKSLWSDAVAQEMNLDLLNAIRFNKGCFIGQEIVARLHHYKRLKKRLFALKGPHLDEADGTLYAQNNLVIGEKRGRFALIKCDAFDTDPTQTVFTLNNHAYTVIWPEWMPCHGTAESLSF